MDWRQVCWHPDGRVETVGPSSLERWLAEGFSLPQIEGVACIDCGKYMGDMVPAGYGPLGQLVRHESCRDRLAREITR